jgi:hypothetical protein
VKHRICCICTSLAFTMSRASTPGPTPHPGAGDPSNVRAAQHILSSLPVSGSDRKSERSICRICTSWAFTMSRASRSGPTPPPGAGDPSNVSTIEPLNIFCRLWQWVSQRENQKGMSYLYFLGIHNVQGIKVWANTAPRGWGSIQRKYHRAT